MNDIFYDLKHLKHEQRIAFLQETFERCIGYHMEQNLSQTGATQSTLPFSDFLQLIREGEDTFWCFIRRREYARDIPTKEGTWIQLPECFELGIAAGNEPEYLFFAYLPIKDGESIVSSYHLPYLG